MWNPRKNFHCPRWSPYNSSLFSYLLILNLKLCRDMWKNGIFLTCCSRYIAGGHKTPCAIYPLLHTWDHRKPWSISVSVIDRPRPSHLDNFTLLYSWPWLAVEICEDLIMQKGTSHGEQCDWSPGSGFQLRIWVISTGELSIRWGGGGVAAVLSFWSQYQFNLSYKYSGSGCLSHTVPPVGSSPFFVFITVALKGI